MLYLLATLQSYVVTTKDRFHRDDRGATAVEYGLLVGLIAIAIITIVATLGGQLGAAFQSVSDSLTDNGVADPPAGG